MCKHHIFRVIGHLTLLLAVILATFIIAPPPLLRGQDTDTAATFERGSLVFNTLKAVSRDYLEQDRIDPRGMLNGALEQIERFVPEVLVTYDDSRAATVTVGIATKKFRTGPVSSLDQLGERLIEMLSFIDAHYTGDIDKNEIEYAAIEGMLGELDPHSAFLSPKVYKEFRIGTRGEFGGLGIVIGIKDGELTVIAPLEGTPAWRAGIKNGDRILQIDDESTVNMSLTDAVNRLRGKVGTAVRIMVSRVGKTAPFSVPITRAIITIDSVQHVMLKENGKRIGYIKLKSFQANSDDDFRAALESFRRDGDIDGLILDVRNNPGGLLNQAIDITDHFLANGTIVKTVVSRGIPMDTEVAHPHGNEPDYPMIVLINEGSASASEIVAGALKANDRALIMGRRSFGKGSVQTIFEIGGGSAIKLTIAQYLPAGSMSIQSVGVTPDVELVPKTVDRKHINLVDDEVRSESDLEKHLEKTGEALEEPVYRAAFYEPYEAAADDDPAGRFKEYTHKPEVEHDFAVQLATKLLASVTSSSRRKILEEIRDPLAASDAAQREIIALHLASLGVDWSPVSEHIPSLLRIAYNIRKGENAVSRARAGSKVELELVATNIGKGTYGQLVAVGQSKNPLLKNLEFVFGKLASGQTRRWRVPLNIPDALPSQDLAMDITFHDLSGNVPEPIKAIIPIDGIEPPRFAFRYQLKERGKLARGIPLHLEVTAFNAGGGASSADTVMTLSNKSGKDVFIQKGRAQLGAMGAGTSRPGSFVFRVAKGFVEPSIKLELAILDPNTLTILTKEFTIDTAGGVLVPPAGVRYEPPLITLTESDSAPETSSATYNLAGTVSGIDTVRDYFIFVDDKKVAYRPNAQETNRMPIEAVLPLAEGNNTVAIAARNGIDLTGRRILVIKRTTGTGAAKKAANDG